MSRLASGELVNETFTKLYFHIVFSTRNRRPLVKEIGELVSMSSWREPHVASEAHTVIVGGVADHVHILVGLRLPTSCRRDAEVNMGPRVGKGGL